MSLLALAIPSIASAALNYIQGRRQTNRARDINPVDPGPNQALEDNARMTGDIYGNYVMPGYAQAEQNIDNAASAAYNTALQGATSSGDILDAASRIAYGTQQSLGNLAAQNATGREQALSRYLSANAAAGTDQTNWARQEYLRDVDRQAQLENAGMLNQNNAIQGGLGVLSTLMTDYFARRQDQNPNSPGSSASISTVRPGASTYPVYTPAGLTGASMRPLGVQSLPRY